MRFVGATALPAPWRLVATIAIFALAPTLPAAAFVMRRFSRAAAQPFLWLAYTWFGTATYLLLGALATQVATLFIDPRTAALLALAGVGATVLYGLVHARTGLRVRRVRIPLAKLPARAEGYTIVQLTDIHIGPTLGARFAREVVAKVNALAPDLIVLTGDLIDGRLADLRSHFAPFGGLRARDGVFAVTGNHEYYWDVDAWLGELAQLGIRVLRNEHVAIAAGFALAGVDDSTSAKMAVGHGEDVPGAVAGCDPARPVVLLAHHPSTIPRAVAAGCDLQLSGHTHGGQMLPLGWLSRLFEPHVAGLARFGATWLYVSEGTGYWGPPLRVGTSCEIALITLAAEAAAP